MFVLNTGPKKMRERVSSSFAISIYKIEGA